MCERPTLKNGILGGFHGSGLFCLVSFVLVLGLGISASNAVPPDLLGWWSCDEGAGSVVSDSSGNGHDGTFVNGGPTWIAGVRGTAIELVGPTVVEIPALGVVLTEATFAGWIKPNGAQPDWSSFLMMRPVATGFNVLGFQLAYHWNDTNSSWSFRGGDMIADGEWTFAAVSILPDQATFYVNGVEGSTNTVAHAPMTFGENLYLGGDGTANWVGRRMNGGLDDVSFFGRALTGDEIQEVMSGLSDPVLAAVAFPEDEGTDVGRDTTLGWTAGEFAQTHNVYLGTVFGDVNEATNPASGGQTDTAFDPGRLEFGQTYYWRVDEVNGAPDSTVFKGDVWSFTVEPFSIPIDGVTATASSSFGVSTPEMTINGSGMSGDLHGTLASDMWISGAIPATLEYAFDRAYKLHELWIWNSNQVIESFVGFGAKDVVVEHSLDGENWTILDGVGPLAQAPGAVGYAHNNTIDFGSVMAQHVRVTVNSVQGIAPQASLSEVRFFFIPVNAREPQPADGATLDGVDAALTWRSGREAGSHEVYLDMDTATTLVATVDENSYLATALELDTTYHWRIDEVNDAESPAVHEGDTWSFSTPASLSVDDMESYADAEFLEIWATWVDGFDDPANGSLVGNGAAGTPETGIVHAGDQSLPLDFGNGGAQVSEATRTFDQAQDWTRSGIQNLVLYLNSGADNTGGQVYVKINDTKVVFEGGADLPPGLWTQWTIDLSAVADAANVRSLTIGVEGAGARGVLYVDSIQLVKDAPAAFLSWFEAESGTITAPMQVFSDSPTASAGQHIGTVDGIGDENDNPPADGVATYSFDVPEDGVYRLSIRVIITGGSNSFWIRIPGMVTNTTNHASGWVRYNDIPDGDAWHWAEVRSSEDGLSVVEFTLSAGTHTLEIARREDGALLDAIAVMN